VRCTLQAVLTAAVEAGCSRALFTDATLHLAKSWQQLAAFEPLTLQQDGSILGQQDTKVGQPSAAIASTCAAAVDRLDSQFRSVLWL
jgi:hypothetical protein